MPSSRSTLIITALVAGLVLPGCNLFERTTIENSAAVQFPGGDQDFEFWDALSKQSVVTNNDALHGLLLLADGSDDCETYECRYEAAVEKGWFEGSWGGMPAADASAKVGWMAVAGCRILEIDGGLTMRLFGDSPRYCSRELTFMRILPAVTENEALSGLEFTAYVDNIEDRQRFDVAVETRKKLQERQKELKREAEAKRISETLTPMNGNSVGGPEQSPGDEASPGTETPGSSPSEGSGTSP